jgi:hypothetical protein
MSKSFQARNSRKQSKTRIPPNLRRPRFVPSVETLEERTLLNGSPVNLSFDPNQFFNQGFVAVEFTIQGLDQQFGVGLLPITLSDPQNVTPTPPTFESLCADAINALPNTAATYPVLPTPIGTALGQPTGGEVAYLFNHYGYFPQQGFDYTANNSLARAVGTQLAIWELIYPSLTDSSFSFIPGYDSYGSTQANFNAALGYADSLHAEAQGKNETAVYLDVSLGGTVANPPGQSLMSPTPTITTTPGKPTTLYDGNKLTDTAYLSGGLSPTGTVTFTLYGPNNAVVDTETAAVNPDGTATTPNGYIPTMSGIYQWVAAYNGDAFNLPISSKMGDEPEMVLAPSPSTPKLTTSASETAGGVVGSAVLSDTATLSGGNMVAAGTPTPTITFNLIAPNGNTVYTEVQTVTGDTSYTTTGTGTGSDVATQVGTYYWNVTYSGNAFNISVTHNGQNYTSEQETTTQATPSLTTSAGETANGVVGGAVLSDTATLSGGYMVAAGSPAPTLTFNLVAPNGSTVYTETQTVTGDTSYTTTGSGTGSELASQVGTYYWNVTYSGNTFNSSVTHNGQTDTSEQVTTIKAMPQLTTSASETAGGVVGAAVISDTATLSGGYMVAAGSPAPTLTFYLIAPNGSTVYTETQTVSASTSTYTTTGSGTGSELATQAGTYYWNVTYSGNAFNGSVTHNGQTDTREQVKTIPLGPAVGRGATATMGFWHNKNGQAVINSFNGSSSSKLLSNWMASNFPNLFGSFAGQTNAQIAADFLTAFGNVGGVQGNTYAQTFAVALAVYATDPTLGGNATAASYGFVVKSGGTGSDSFNVGSNGAAFGVPNNTLLSVFGILQILNSNYNPTTHQFYGGSQTLTSAANNVTNGINQGGDINATLTDAGLAYTPEQIRTAYGINNLSLDGTGQTIAIVDAYDDPAIFQALDTFDAQFGLTSSGPTLYDQYGPASSFLTVLNQSGQATPLPGTDPSGAGTSNWEVETALDVEWVHAIAPGAQIILVEANSQSLADLMTSVRTAASQPGVSVVSMSWGFPEGLGVVQEDEVLYDSYLTTPAGHQGVTFVASAGDYGTADLEYPAVSPNVVAIGGTSLSLNADNSYNSETGWGYNAASMGGTFIGSGGGVSLYETEPAFQQSVQSTGYRTAPDVSLIADPGTGAWIADPYNLAADNPWEVVGGTSLSAPAWAGIITLANQGRTAAGMPTLNSASPTQTQEALYNLPESDFNDVTTGSNGFSAGVGYDLVTGLGTPVAKRLVPDLAAYNGAVSSHRSVTVSGDLPQGSWGGSPDTIASFVGGTFNVFNAEVVARGLGGFGHGQGVFGRPMVAAGVETIAPVTPPVAAVAPAAGSPLQAERTVTLAAPLVQPDLSPVGEAAGVANSVRVGMTPVAVTAGGLVTADMRSTAAAAASPTLGVPAPAGFGSPSGQPAFVLSAPSTQQAIVLTGASAADLSGQVMGAAGSLDVGGRLPAQGGERDELPLGGAGGAPTATAAPTVWSVRDDQQGRAAASSWERACDACFADVLWEAVRAAETTSAPLEADDGTTPTAVPFALAVAIAGALVATSRGKRSEDQDRNRRPLGLPRFGVSG